MSPIVYDIIENTEHARRTECREFESKIVSPPWRKYGGGAGGDRKGRTRKKLY